MKSITCFSKSGNPLSVFMTEREAQGSADYERGQGRNLYPYQCKKCGLWHLAPEESRVDFRENACSCTDSRGNGKRLYATREDAEKAMETSEEARNVSLSVYPCPDGGGWHLTHSAGFYF
ncbi:MAG: hypothetical protein J1E07_07510 [Treponema sp.]|nr:hypothetical protein [Treponema sp.]